jgi:hypothetical protein
MSRENFVDKLKFAVKAYEQLYFGHVALRAPYFINYPGLAYESTLKDKFDEQDMKKVQELRRGQHFTPWAYQGKATPGELIEATTRAAGALRQPLAELNADGIEMVMQLFGIGVDCSGFVFNVLTAALEAHDKADFLQGLEGRGAFRANVKRFAAEENSLRLDFSGPEVLLPGDFIVDAASHTHILLIVDIQGSELTIAHSAMYTLPRGVNTFNVSANNASQLSDRLNALPSVYTYTPQTVYEVRRLRVMQNG